MSDECARDEVRRTKMSSFVIQNLAKSGQHPNLCSYCHVLTRSELYDCTTFIYRPCQGAGNCRRACLGRSAGSIEVAFLCSLWKAEVLSPNKSRNESLNQSRRDLQHVPAAGSYRMRRTLDLLRVGRRS